MSHDELKEMEERRLVVAQSEGDCQSQSLDSSVAETSSREHRLQLQELTGQTFGGQYEIIELLGFGGIGAVYKAKDHVLNRFVAIKTIHQSLTPERLMRFQREGQILGMVVHPSIGAVHGLGTSESDVPYMVLEYVEGEVLSDVLRNYSPLNPSWTVRIISQLCHALHLVHQKGVVHRDLKPDNIIISKGPNDTDFPKVIDFGIARQSHSEQHLTQQGAVIGSPRYMSPEQCAGKALDARSDQYSMACILYEMLSGEPIFAGNSALELASKHMSETPPRLPKQYSHLQRVLDKALAKEPADRYETIVEFTEELDTKFYLNPRRMFLHHPHQIVTLANKRKLDGNEEKLMVTFWLLLLGIIVCSIMSLVSSAFAPAIKGVFVVMAGICSVLWLYVMFTSFSQPASNRTTTDTKSGAFAKRKDRS